MIDHAELACQLMGVFLDELDEHVATFRRDFSALQRGAGDPAEQAASVFRAAHGLRGAARVVGQNIVSDAAHHVEDLLAEVRSGARPVTPELCAFGLEVAEIFGQACQRLRTAQPLEGTAVAGLRERVQQFIAENPVHSAVVVMAAEAGRPSSSRTPTQIPTEAPPSGLAQRRPGAANAANAAHGGPIVDAKVSAQDPTQGREAANDGRSALRVSTSELDDVAVRAEELVAAVAQHDELVDRCERLLTVVRGHQTGWRLAGAPANANAHETDTLVGHVEAELTRLARASAAAQLGLKKAAQELHTAIYGLQTAPFERACLGLDGAVQDLAQELGKHTELLVEGGEIEFDRWVVERLQGPLMHLIKNAVDHGVETEAERTRAGKPALATVRVFARMGDGTVEVSIADDGRGLDLAGIRAAAQQRGLPMPSDKAILSELISYPGFATAKRATQVPAHDVGMDAVGRQLETLRGTVGLESKPGHGTTVTLTIPVAVAKVRALLVEANGKPYAVPDRAILSVHRLDEGLVRVVAGETLMIHAGQHTAVSPLTQVLWGRPLDGARASARIVVLEAGGVRYGFIVDRVLDERQVAVKSLGPRLQRVPGVCGCTIVRGQELALVLSAADLIAKARSR